MGQFKPMVKMMTTEPSVILKLKKGGKVASKADGGYMPMQSSMPAQEAPTMPARGGLAAAASPMKPSMAARRKAMMAKPAMSPTLMKKGGKADDMGQDKAMIKKAFKQHDMQEHEKGSTKLKLKHGGMMDGGGTHMMPDGKMMKNSAMKHGGKFATGGVVNGQGGYAKGGIIKSTKGETKVVTAKVDHSPAKTGDVKLGNGGGYKHGGKAMMNGGTMGGYATGGVAKSNAGGYKMGGAAKKAYATGGTVDTGKPVAMPKKAASRPVANSMQSGTFKKGGKVNKFSEGGDASKGAYDKAIGPSDDDMDMAKAIRSVPRKLYEGAKSMMGMGKTEPKAGSVTKTEKSITVAPKKRGGSAC